MKKVLIITYYWPPSGGSGVQRWLKFAKYLPQFGWQPIIYTPENPDFNLKDESLLADISEETVVIKRPIWEPYRLQRLLTGKKKANNVGLVKSDEKMSWKARLMQWIRGNLFIPDPRVYWVRPSVQFLRKYIQENGIEVVITTGPPHSMHLIGLGLKKQIGIRWLVDIRDPWANFDMLGAWHLSDWARKKYQQQEQTVLNACDGVIATAPSMNELLSPFDERKYHVITNGYDEKDFEDVAPSIASSKWTIFHAGLLNSNRNPIALWDALAELCETHPDFDEVLQIHLAGIIDEGIQQFLKNHPLLSDKVIIDGYLSHSEVIQYYQQTDVLLLLINNTDNYKSNIPGKLFEYFAAEKPILSVGKLDADATQLVETHQRGFGVTYEDVEQCKITIEQLFHEKQISKLDTSQFSRKRLTQQLARVLGMVKK